MNLLKAIFQGTPGSGKTTLLASAANAGYEVILLDYDECPEPLFAYTNEEGRKRISTQRFNSLEKHKKFIETLKDKGSETIIALDSLTEMTPIVEENISANSINIDPRMLMWQTGQELEALCRRLKKLKCHVVVLSHLRLVSPHVESGYINSSGQYKGQDTALQRQVKAERARLEETAFYPNVPSESIARNFVHLFPFSLVTAIDEDAKHASKRVVYTKPIPGYQIKCPIADIADKLPIETALITLLNGLKSQ